MAGVTTENGCKIWQNKGYSQQGNSKKHYKMDGISTRFQYNRKSSKSGTTVFKTLVSY